MLPLDIGITYEWDSPGFFSARAKHASTLAERMKAGSLDRVK